MTTPATLAQRFSDRLTLLLNEQGFPLNYSSRCKKLADLVKRDTSFAVTLLDGKKLPEWDIFCIICAELDKSPGYFLDEAAAEPFPPESEIVEGATGGESIVWRPPVGMEPHKTPRRLAWLSGKEHQPNIQSGDVVIFDVSDSTSLRSESIYVVSMGGRYRTKTCHMPKPTTAVLTESHEPPLILHIPTPGPISVSSLQQHGIESIGQVVGTMRLAKNFSYPAPRH